MRQFWTLSFLTLALSLPAAAQTADNGAYSSEPDARRTVQLPAEFFSGGLVGGVEAQMGWQWVYIDGYAYRVLEPRRGASARLAPFPQQSRVQRRPDFRQRGSAVPPQGEWRRQPGH